MRRSCSAQRGVLFMDYIIFIFSRAAICTVFYIYNSHIVSTSSMFTGLRAFEHLELSSLMFVPCVGDI